MTLKTLEERIRAKAREELEKEIGLLFAPIRTRLNALPKNGYCVICFPTATPPVEVKDVFMKSHFDGLQSGIIEALAPAAEDAAISDFIRKVDGLQEQIDELNIQQ
jgi:hypothetical protein